MINKHSCQILIIIIIIINFDDNYFYTIVIIIVIIDNYGYWAIIDFDYVSRMSENINVTDTDHLQSIIHESRFRTNLMNCNADMFRTCN